MIYRSKRDHNLVFSFLSRINYKEYSETYLKGNTMETDPLTQITEAVVTIALTLVAVKVVSTVMVKVIDRKMAKSAK
jgi:hypothetical protein